MSHNDCILKLLNIKDPNLKVIDVIDNLNNGTEKLVLIKAVLSYPINRCRNCGFATVNKNGFAKAHVRLPSLNGIRYEMILRKQRYQCKNCRTTFGATSELTKPNQTLSRKLKNQIMLLAREGLNGELIARICHCSASSVRRTIVERIKPQYRVPVLPKNLCFDEFRSIKNTTSFICCDAQTHKLVVKLPDRLSSTIINYFENRYSKFERDQVESVVIDLNAQYQRFIRRLFPNAKIVIDRFHIVQLAGRALDSCRIALTRSLNKHSREYKILKSQWRLFHKKSDEIDPKNVVYLRGINEYMTQQNAIDLIINKFSEFKIVYQTYQDITLALKNKDITTLNEVLDSYERTNTEMDTTIRTFRKNRIYLINSVTSKYSNGPLEGINRKIKLLKRSCYGFANQQFFFLRIDCIFA